MAKQNKSTTARNTAYQIKAKAWKNYTERLRSLSETASKELEDYIRAGHTEEEILNVAYALVTKYGEASSELACQMYEAIAAYSGAEVAAAEAAATATYSETAKSIRGTMKRTKDAAVISSSAGRLVKMASVDTMMKNALRDGAEWAWIPQGDTCAYCIMLASRGWVKASEDAINNGHAEHIHNNCDCTYCVRFDHETTVEGYGNGEEYYAMYHDQEGIDQSIIDDLVKHGYDLNTPKGRMAALRRQHYANNKDYIRAQQNAAYARRIEFRRASDYAYKRHAKVMSLNPVELDSLKENAIINTIGTHEDAIREIEKLGAIADDSIREMEIDALRHSIAGIVKVADEFPEIDIRRIIISNSGKDYGEYDYESFFMYFSKKLLNGEPALAFPTGLHESGHAVDRLMSERKLGTDSGYAASVVKKALNNLSVKSRGKKNSLRLSLSSLDTCTNDEEVFAGAFELWGAGRKNILSDEIIRIVKEDYNSVIYS